MKSGLDRALGGLTGRVVLAGGAVVVLVALMLVVLVVTANDLYGAGLQTAHSDAVLEASARAQGEADVAQTAMSGSILSDSGVLEAEARDAAGRMQADLRTLAHLVSDNRRQAARVRAIQAATSLLAGFVASDAGPRLRTADQRLATARSMQSRREVLDGMYLRFNAAERMLQLARATRAGRLHQRAAFIGFATLGTSILLILGLVSVFAAWVVQPLRRLARTATRIAGGEEGLAVETGGAGELGELQAAFNEMTGNVLDRRRAILDHAPIAIWEKVGDSISWMSPYWSVLTGREQPVGSVPVASLAASIHPDDLDGVMESHRLGAERGGPYGHRYRMMQPDGSFRHMWTRTTPLGRDEAGELKVIGFTIDVSDEELAREQMLHSQRLESVGQLAGGIAHDFNNLLTVISGYTAMMRNKLPADGELKAPLEQVALAAERAAALTRQLLAFSRKQVLLPQPLEVNDVIRGLIPMLDRLIEEHVELSVLLAEELPLILFDRGQLEQVLVNLIVNARDACPGGGTVTVETGRVYLDASYTARHPDARVGEHVVIAISDTGTGMDQETLERIFDPFFTTKEIGEGTGLGLSTVHGIVKQSGGNIWVYSELGHGTTFKIYMPVTGLSTEAQSQDHIPDAQVVPLRRGRVLVVEDNEALHAFAVEVLRSAGHSVLSASSVAEANEILATNPIDLVLTDLVMRGGSGRSLAAVEDSERRRPRLIYMSGYTAETITRDDLVESDARFLEKPFSPETLLALVEFALTTVAASGGSMEGVSS